MSEGVPGLMAEPEAISLLYEYGIPYPDHGVARSAEEAAGIAQDLGYPVVLKVVSPGVSHKTDVGGVVVGLEDATDVIHAFHQIVGSVTKSQPGSHVREMLVCRQAPEGQEVIVGAVKDAMFGPAIMFGLGGIFAEVLQDVAFRVLPIQASDAEEMVREIRGYPLVAGTRGQAANDVQALSTLLLSVSRLVFEKPEIEELDLNPVRLYEKGLMVLDARIVMREMGQ